MEREKIVKIGKSASVDEKLDLILNEIVTIKSDISGLKADVSELKIDVSALKKDVAEIKVKIDDLDRRVTTLEATTSEIKMLIECEIRPNIMRVAEGHFDVLRVTGEIVKKLDEHEFLSIRTSMLESDVKALKYKVLDKQ